MEEEGRLSKQQHLPLTKACSLWDLLHKTFISYLCRWRDLRERETERVLEVNC